MTGTREIFGERRAPDGPNAWSTDPVADFVWAPGRFYTAYRLVDLSNSADVKLPWELSRCHHLVSLAKHAYLNRDNEVAQRVAAEILEWIELNPFCRSVNWTCAMEAAIRAVNWLWVLRLCGNQIRDNEVRTINASLFAHGVFIFANLEKHPIGYSSNHYYADLIGLVCLGLYFEGERDARRWVDFALPELYRETRTQFHVDGPNHELATSYHRLSSEMLVSVICLMRRHGRGVPPDIEARARAAINYVAHYTRVDGSVPLIGDADDGRLHILGAYRGWQRDSHAHLLSVGHALFGEALWRRTAVADYEDAAWMLDSAAVFELAGAESSPTSKAFAGAGSYIMRHGDDLIFVKAANQGAYETEGWHTHNDVLSFDLTLGGHAFVVDPGVGNYCGDVDERNAFRSTRAHATVMIDDIEQNSLEPGRRGLWANGGEARPTVEEWSSTDEEDLLRAHHIGYLRLRSPVIHHREFRFRKPEHAFEVTDTFACVAEHVGEWNFVLHPEVGVHRQDDRHWELVRGGVRILCECDVPLGLVAASFSPSYKQKRPTLALRGRRTISSGTSCRTRFVRSR